MKQFKRVTLLMALLLICLIATSCSSFRKAIYVPPGKAVELRQECWVPVWVKSEDGTIIRGWVRAGQYWRLGPPPWVRKEK
jgi:hypothetical protein